MLEITPRHLFKPTSKSQIAGTWPAIVGPKGKHERKAPAEVLGDILSGDRESKWNIPGVMP
jgi:hypothetical protein